MNRDQSGGLSTLLLMPSFYGASAWVFWLMLYQLRLIAWDPSPLLADVMFLVVLAFYVTSTITWYAGYRRWQASKDKALISPPRDRQPVTNTRLLLGVLHAVGFLGIALYVRAFASALGGLEAFTGLLVGASAMIRRQTELTSSVGTQLSYLGWIAIALTCFEYRRGRVGHLWVLLAVIQFAANLLYIDRTRPFTILFTTALLVFISTPIARTRHLLFRATMAVVVFGVVFLVIATWIGKIAVEGQYGASSLPLWGQSLYDYGTEGFAYFSYQVRAQEVITYVPERALYPALKALAALNVVPPPPSQLNDYYFTPFSTNVGTFLEPFYHDGGLAFAFAAIVLHSFGLDMLGLALLKTGRRLALFGWANLCFVTFISFFTPKITGFPTWLFTGLAVAAALWPRSLRPIVAAGPGLVTAKGGG